ncbi:MAG TPA: branched-chain amino acid ABC transporter permease [Dehalococcoidia bacterium]|nr:branched-chain amino acid ABC transporter permease [Dehalococcoidia bacterium]
MDVDQNMKVPVNQLRLMLPVVLVAVLAIFPIIGIPRVWLLYLFLFFVYLAMANMWNLLAGYSGLTFLGPAALIGLAGYTLVTVTWNGLPFYLGIIGGGIVAAAFAALIAIPTFRMRGIYFAIGTLVVPEALRYVFYLWKPVPGDFIGGGAGYIIKGIGGLSLTEFYWLALAIGIVSIFLMRIILRSKLGLGLAAIRDNDRAAASSGVDVYRLKLYAFVIAAFVTGAAGAIFYIYQGYIAPAGAFNIRWLMTCLLATVIGGIRTEEGPIVGTAIVVFLHFLLARYGALSLLIQGVILVVIMLLVPGGIVGLVRRKTRNYQSLLQLAIRR